MAPDYSIKYLNICLITVCLVLKQLLNKCSNKCSNTSNCSLAPARGDSSVIVSRFNFQGSLLFYSEILIKKLYLNMAKDKKKGPKANIFKVAGAKSLKKAKAKKVNLGLKNMKQKISEIDKQLADIKNNPKSINEIKKQVVTHPQISEKTKVTKEEVASATEQIVKMDL